MWNIFLLVKGRSAYNAVTNENKLHGLYCMKSVVQVLIPSSLYSISLKNPKNGSVFFGSFTYYNFESKTYNYTTESATFICPLKSVGSNIQVLHWTDVAHCPHLAMLKALRSCLRWRTAIKALFLCFQLLLFTKVWSYFVSWVSVDNIPFPFQIHIIFVTTMTFCSF